MKSLTLICLGVLALSCSLLPAHTTAIRTMGRLRTAPTIDPTPITLSTPVPSVSPISLASPSPPTSTTPESSGSLRDSNSYNDDGGAISLDSASKIYTELSSVASHSASSPSSSSDSLHGSSSYDYLLHSGSSSDSVTDSSIADTPVDSIRSAFMQLSASDPSTSSPSDVERAAIVVQAVLPSDARSPIQPLVSTVDGPIGRSSPRKYYSGDNSDAPPDKLDLALDAVRQDILVKNRQIEQEKVWVSQVKKITDEYTEKIRRVNADVEKTKQDVHTLYRKKKQIENLKIQKKLEVKLKDATNDLNTLQGALEHVKSKADEFAKTKGEIKDTIQSINTQLAKLKGEKPKKEE